MPSPRARRTTWRGGVVLVKGDEMGKKNDEDRVRPITITTGDEPPEPNTTLIALLRDGEKLKPGDPRGTLADRLGAEAQTFMASQTRVAKHRRAAVKGSLTLRIDFVSGPDGSHGYAVSTTTKAAKIPPGVSLTFADEDGEMTGRPVEPLTEEMYRREAKNTNATEPKVGAASKM